MDTVSVNRFRDNLKSFVEQVVNQHMPIVLLMEAVSGFHPQCDVADLVFQQSGG